MIINASKLMQQYGCPVMSDHEHILELMSKQDTNYYQLALNVNEIISTYVGKYNDDMYDILHRTVEEACSLIEAPTRKTKEEKIESLFIKIRRYLKSENRNLKKAKQVIVYPLPENKEFGVRLSPSFVVEGFKEFTRRVPSKAGSKKTISEKSLEPYFEIIRIKYGAPKVSNSSKRKDFCAAQNMELNCMLEYAKTFIPDMIREIGECDATWNVCASFYYLGKKTDRIGAGEYDEDFFNPSGGNIVSLWDKITVHFKPDMSSVPEYATVTSQTEVGRELLREYTSKKCSPDPENCKLCSFNQFCYFENSPQPIKTSSEHFKRSKILLSEEQKRVAAFTNGIALVNASAGAGKTAVITVRISELLRSGCPGSQIMAVSFSESAAKEVSQRVNQLTTGKRSAINSTIFSVTFHSLGFQMLQERFRDFGYTKEPTLNTPVENKSMVKTILDRNYVQGLDYSNFYMDTKNCRGALSVTIRSFALIKSHLLSSGDEHVLSQLLEKQNVSVDKETLAQLFHLYDIYSAMMKANNLMDYSDMEISMVKILSLEPDYFAKRYGLRHIVVDEYQDTNANQFLVMNALCSSENFESLMVVGDDSQAVYRFRGADTTYITEFTDKMNALGKNVAVFYLTSNFRSTPQIIHLSNAVNELIVNRIKKDMVPVLPSGDEVVCEQFWKQDDLDSYILDTYHSLHEKGYEWKDIMLQAVTGAKLLHYSELLTKEGIPNILLNPEHLMTNSRVSAAVSLLKYLADESDNVSAVHYLNAYSRNGILSMGEEILDHEINVLKKVKADLFSLPSEMALAFLNHLLNELDMNDEIYQYFISQLFRKPTLDEIIEYALDFERYGEDETKRRELTYPCTSLVTPQSSKGTEKKVVITDLTGYHTERIGKKAFPGIPSDDTEIEDARRLLFVSLTRAKEKLYVVGLTKAGGSKPRKKGDEDTRFYNAFLGDVFHILDKPYITEKEQ